VSWLAILLALASLGGSSTASRATPKKCGSAKTHCKAKANPKPKKQAKPKPAATPAPSRPSTLGAKRDDSPSSPDSPQATPTAAPPSSTTPTPTATPVTYPSRTGVELLEWRVRPAFRTLAAGRIDFNAANQGEDDHNLSVRAAGKEYGHIDLAPGEEGSLVLQLSAGTYTLYCSLPDHEEAGMRTDISVR
jgi:plastocyanin